MSNRLFRSLSLVTIAVVAIAFTLPARAEEDKDAKPKHTKSKKQWTGELVSVDATAGTCTLKKKDKEGKEVSKTFKCAADCKVTGADDKPATMADLKAGQKVTVSFTEEGDKLTCHSMVIKPAKAAKVDKKEEKAK